MQRAIASQGAFAIVYGRQLKQYIKETEVYCLDFLFHIVCQNVIDEGLKNGF